MKEILKNRLLNLRIEETSILTMLANPSCGDGMKNILNIKLKVCRSKIEVLKAKLIFYDTDIKRKPRRRISR